MPPSPHFKTQYSADKKTDLSAAVDVYADWVDACDAVAKQDGQELTGGGDAPLRVPQGQRSGGRSKQTEDEDGDGDLDDLIDDEDDAGYARDGVAADDDY